MNNIFRYLESFYIPKLVITDIIEIIIIIILVYQMQKSLKNTRAWVIIKGIIVLAIVYLCSSILGLNVIQTIFQGAISLCVIAAIILFEPEIKKFLEELGTHSIKDIFKSIKNKDPISINKKYSDKTIKEILEACTIMSEAKTGALIIIEQDSILNEYINTGIPINADISSQLLINIFEHNTPLHDGAIIIRKDKIISATCYLPLSSNEKINKKLGTRHRAGIGLSEITDAIVIIVSEETGKISFVKDGILKHGVNIETLHNLLKKYQTNENIAIKNKKQDILKEKKNKLKRNLGAKLLCGIFGIFLWVSIINSQNPLTTRTFEIPVNILHENALTNVGKTYEIIDGETITIEVTAARNIVNSLTEEDIVATADFNKLSYTYSVPIETNIPNLSKSEYTINTNNASLQLKLDEKAELSIELQIEEIGKCDKDYCATEISSNTKEITISGGESIIKTIDKAIVKVNLMNSNQDITSKSEIEVYDKNGNIIDLSLLELSQSEAIVNVTIKPTKTIPINISLLNEKSNSYSLTSINPDLTKLKIAGNKEDLDKIDKLDIVIDVSKEQISETYIKTLSLEEFLPDKIYLTDENKKLNISMQFNIYTTKEFEINTNNIKVENLSNDLKIDFKNNNLKLKFKGLKKDIETLDINKLLYSLDCKDLVNGEYSLQIKIDSLPTNITLVSDGIVPFTLKNK